MSHKKIPLLLLALGAALSGCGGKSAAETIVQAEEVLITDAEATDEIPAGADTAGGTAAGDNTAGGSTAGADAADGTTADTDAADGNPAGADAAGDTEPEAVLSGGSDTADAAGAGTDTAPEEYAEEPELPAYEVTPLKEATVMYAAASLNVRQGPSTGYEIVGSLDYGEDITVTGQADTGWYEIEYQDGRDFVSDEYVLAERPEDQNAAGIILVGDSRFVQMQNSVGENSCTWIAETGKGYKWFSENAVAQIDSCVGKGSKILINLGVNDLGNSQKYLTLVNSKAEEWVDKGAQVYYASVNPVRENPYVTEEQVENFNSQMQDGLSADVTWIDSHSYLCSIEYQSPDGLHYNKETSRNLYDYYMSCL